MALPLVALGRELTLFDVSTVTLVPPEEYRTSDENRREGSCEDADDEDEGQVVDYTRAKDVKRCGGEQSCDTREQSTREHPVDRQINDTAQIRARVEL